MELHKGDKSAMSYSSPGPVPADDNGSPQCASKFPSAVAFKHFDGKKQLFSYDSPKGSITATTGMMTSPLSSVHQSPRRRHSDHSSQQRIDKHTHFHLRLERPEADEPSRDRSGDLLDLKEMQIPNNMNKQRSSKTSRRRRQQSCSTRHDTLTWRMDPNVSLSDFTLTVVGIEDSEAIHKYLTGKEKRLKKKRSKRRDKWMVEGLYLDMSQSEDSEGDCENIEKKDEVQSKRNNPMKEQYNLHKVNLAVGLRSCDYFSRLFQKHLSSSNDSPLREHLLELPKSSLQAIPAMLDYVYDPSPTSQVNATTTSAIPLRHLAKQFGNRLLFDSATRFLQMDLKPETAVSYLQQAETYKQKKLAEVCVRVCAESFTQIKMTSLSSLEPKLMIKVLHCKYFRPDIESRVICAKIASYCRCQEKSVDARMFLLLTSENVMQEICPEEALFFIQFMIELGIDLGSDNQKAGRLYERCILAAPYMMQEVVNSSTRASTGRIAKNASGNYAKLPPQIKVQLLEFALKQQQLL